MTFKMVHNNLNVFDLQKSLDFYAEALDLHEVRRIAPESGDFIIVFLANEMSQHQLEVTWVRNWEKPYDLGDNEFHLAFETDDYKGALAKHKEMGCVCFENEAMGIYFIEDPDGYWHEIVPAK